MPYRKTCARIQVVFREDVENRIRELATNGLLTEPQLKEVLQIILGVDENVDERIILTGAIAIASTPGIGRPATFMDKFTSGERTETKLHLPVSVDPLKFPSRQTLAETPIGADVFTDMKKARNAALQQELGAEVEIVQEKYGKQFCLGNNETFSDTSYSGDVKNPYAAGEDDTYVADNGCAYADKIHKQPTPGKTRKLKKLESPRK